jgi:hypothetical protein
MQIRALSNEKLTLSNLRLNAELGYRHGCRRIVAFSEAALAAEIPRFPERRRFHLALGAEQ